MTSGRAYWRNRESPKFSNMLQRSLFLFGIPLAVAILAIISEYSGFDLWLAGHFYDPVSQSWPYESRFLTTTVLHTGAKDFMVLIALLNLLSVPITYFIPNLRPYSKHLLYVFVAALTGSLVVGELKSLTHICTPWELTQFDGDKPYIRLFDAVPPGAEVGYGFAYLGLYFALMIQGHRYRYHALLVPLLLGITFSVTQEIRGAHFLSHDMFSFVICWTSALLWLLVIYGRDILKSAHTRTFNLPPMQG